jgi:hypothetical protein
MVAVEPWGQQCEKKSPSTYRAVALSVRSTEKVAVGGRR